MATKLKIDPTNYNKFFYETLEGVEYVIHLYWNNSMSRRSFSKSGWYLSLYNSELFDESSLVDEQEIALIYGGIKLMPNSNVLGEAVMNTLPKGLLLCADTKPELGIRDDYYVGLDNFGTGKRFELYYYTEREVQELT